jgi:hypothetical protein
VGIASLHSFRGAIAALAVAAALAATLLEFGVWTRTVAFIAPFPAHEGHAFRADLTKGVLSDFLLTTGGNHSQWPTSRLRLFEDGVELRQAHTPHTTIAALGGGRFSHWRGSVYFSASDNSDPNASGRVYTATYPMTVRGWLWGGIFAALAIGLRLYGREIHESLARGRRALTAARQDRIRLALWSLVFVACIAFPVYVVLEHLGSGRTTAQTIGGLVPWLDSVSWLYSAFRILITGEAPEWSARRPINTVFLASVLGAAGHNVPIALLIRAACLGAVVYLFILQTMRSFGVAAALMGAAVLYSFAHPFLSTGLSEVNGLIFGTLGIVLLLHAVQARSSAWFAVGLFFLTVGLLTRSGAFFVLPALLAWSAFLFAETRRAATRPVVTGSCAIAAAWLVSKALTYAYMPPGVGDNANFPLVLYGLAKGGQSWVTFCDDIEKLKGISCFKTADSVLARMAYEHSIDLIVADPRPFVVGMAKFTARFFRDTGNYLPQVGRVLFLIVAAIGLLSCVRGGAGAPGRFILVALIGIVASSGLIHWSEDGYRLFAATRAIDALIAAAGVHAVGRFITGAPAAEAGMPKNHFDFATKPGPAAAAATFGLLLLVFAAFAPVVLRAAPVPAASASSMDCPADEKKVTIQLGRSSIFIRLTSAHAAFAPEVAYEKFHRDPTFGNVEIADFLRTLKVGDMLIVAFDLGERNRGEGLWLRMSDAGSLVDGRFYVLCARPGTIATQMGPMAMHTVTAFREIRAQP